MTGNAVRNKKEANQKTASQEQESATWLLKDVLIDQSSGFTGVSLVIQSDDCPQLVNTKERCERIARRLKEKIESTPEYAEARRLSENYRHCFDKIRAAENEIQRITPILAQLVKQGRDPAAEEDALAANKNEIAKITEHIQIIAPEAKKAHAALARKAANLRNVCIQEDTQATEDTLRRAWAQFVDRCGGPLRDLLTVRAEQQFDFSFGPTTYDAAARDIIGPEPVTESPAATSSSQFMFGVSEIRRL